MDEGFKQSEKMLNELEAKLHKEYLQATKEMTEKVDKYFAKFKDEDEKQKARYEKGEITKKEYTEWRKRKMLTGKRYTQMRDTLASDLTKTAQIAMKYVDNKAIDVYALNMNYETYNIEHETRVDTSFTLYNHDAVQRLIKENPELLPQPKVDVDKSERWNLQHIQSAITQGILQGEAIPKIAKRMQRVTNMEKSAAIRNARTAMTGAQNGGRLDSMKRAQGRGIEVKKGWLATLDGRTRDSHAVMDGEEVELDEKFSNGLRFPGDPNGRPAEVYNCRCRMVHVFPKYRTDWSNMENRNTSKLGDMSYEEWKNKHKEKFNIKMKSKTKEQPQDKYKYVVPKVSIVDAIGRFTSDKSTEIRKASNGEEIYATKFDVKTKTRTQINVTEKYKNDAEAIEVFIYESPKVKEPLYRGITVDDKTLEQFKVGEVINQHGISSWTTYQKTADNFGRITEKTPNKVIFVEKEGTEAGRDITDMSLAKGYDKNEVIQSAYTEQEIIEIKEKNGITYIYVKEVKNGKNSRS
jgi:SPP1 gp7 family putative phage head morphogenesis protein